MKEKMFTVGKIINTHGLKGEVKVLRITDFEERFKKGSHVYIIKDQEEIEVVIETHRVHKGFDLLTFADYPSINDVEQFKNCPLQIKEEQLTELEEDEFYYHEIIGCKVYTTAGEELGKIKEILAPGANDVWVVQRKDAKDLLIPYIEDVVKQIDVEKGSVMIEPMEGLLD